VYLVTDDGDDDDDDADGGSSSSSSFIRSINIKQSCTAMQYSGAGQQRPRKDTDSCPKKKHDMTAMHFTINQHYK